MDSKSRGDGAGIAPASTDSAATPAPEPAAVGPAAEDHAQRAGPADETAAASDGHDPNEAGPDEPERSGGDGAVNGRRAADSGELIELGLGTFLMSGNGANAMMGPTPYAVVEVKRGLYVRPAVIVGQSLVPLGDSTNVNAFFLAGRLEACARFPGNYMPNRGLELAVCGGADAGYTYFHAAPAGYTSWGAPREATILPQVSAGPSLDLRGELGAGWSLVLRGMAGVNTIRTGFDDSNGGRVTPSWVTGRIELAFAWRLR